MSLLAVRTCNRITFTRLVRDDNKLPHSEKNDVSRHCYLPLGVAATTGDVSFSSLLADYFVNESYSANLAITAGRVSELQGLCRNLVPPVQPHEPATRQLRIDSLPTYLCVSPIILSFTETSVERKAVNISMPDTIDVQPFVDVSVAAAGPVIYDLTDVVVHIGRGDHKAAAALRDRGRQRALRKAAASGHFVMYTKLSASQWYSV